MIPERLDDDYRLCEVYEARLVDSAVPDYEDMIAFEHTDGKFYFATVDGAGGLHMRSEGYPNIGARAVGMKSVNRFRGKRTRYGVIERGGRYYTILRAQNGLEILRSCAKDSRAAAEALMPALSAAARALAERSAADAEATAALDASSSDEEVDAEDAELGTVTLRGEADYLPCEAYGARIEDARAEGYDDVIAFQHDDGKYYFAVLDDEGGVGLRSAGYPTKGVRTQALKSVLRNRRKRQRFDVEERGGEYYAVLYAQQGQEIARGCAKASRVGAEGLFPAMSAATIALAAGRGEDVSAEQARFDAQQANPISDTIAARDRSAPKQREAAPPPEFAEVDQDAKVDDDYLVCSAYEARLGDSKDPNDDRVIVFQHPSGKYYFATLDEDGGLGLRSEGYPTTGARDTGLKAVRRSLKKRNRYKVEERRGLYYVVLYAQNGQEVGRSCPKKDRGAAEGMIPAASAASMALAAQAKADAAAAEAKAREVAEAEAAATAEAAAKPQGGDRLQDNYLVCSAYEARLGDSADPKHDGVIQFAHANGLYYFATVNEDGGLGLRSEGYPNEGARAVGLKAVLRNRTKRQRYKLEEKRGLHYTVLYAQNGQEIGRSCPKKDRALAEGLMPGLSAASLALAAAAATDPEPTAAPTTEAPATEATAAAGAAVVGAAAIGAAAMRGNDEMSDPPAPLEPAVPKAEPEPEAEPVAEAPQPIVPTPPPAAKEPEDDYLACKEYAGRKINDKVNRVALFKHKNRQYYFAFYDHDNKVRLRSEGFATAKGRDKELSGALRFQHDEDKWERITVGGRYINVLRDDTGREVGRSCIAKAPVPFMLAPLAAAGAGAAGLAGAAAVAAAAPVVTPAPVVSPAPVVTPAPVAAAPVTPVSAPKAAPVVADKGGTGWWLWALLGLLALGLALWLLRGCLGCGDPAAVAVATPAVDPPAAAAPAVVAEPAPVVPVEPAPIVDAAPAPPPPPPPPTAASSASTTGAACGPLVANAPESSYGVPLLSGGDYGGLAGDLQDFLAGAEASATYPLAGIEFMPSGSDYAVEPCSVGNVDRLAAVLRSSPEARITVSAPTARECASLKRLLTYRGVDASQIEVQPDGASEITVRRL